LSYITAVVLHAYHISDGGVVRHSNTGQRSPLKHRRYELLEIDGNICRMLEESVEWLKS